ncbi:MAG: TIM barrel protein [Chitinophagaceae bacterium]|nr:TIM barrel protein [Chitinophagaceae bacterium]MDP3666785.1 TIM barrel protein [Sediminibacterium sp.]
MTNSSNRRLAIKNIIAALAVGTALPSFAAAATAEKKKFMLKGNINHSVCRWCFNDIPLDQLCVAANEIGLRGIDLVGPKDWDTLKKYNLVSSMCNGAEIGLTKGWNDKQYHATLIKNYTEHIDLVANAGFKNLFCASGNRNGMDDETGLRNCVDGLKQVIGLAEKKGVILTMELLNSKIDHKDYMCDRTQWGVELCKRIGSPNFKLLYDIYHMQIDEGDVIRTIKDNNTYIGHYHTAGVPGRHEIDETQELYYPAIMKAILETGFTDYVAQEFIPLATDKLGSLKKAVMICDV